MIRIPGTIQSVFDKVMTVGVAVLTGIVRLAMRRAKALSPGGPGTAIWLQSQGLGGQQLILSGLSIR
jgi:hypothetical protein